MKVVVWVIVLTIIALFFGISVATAQEADPDLPGVNKRSTDTYFIIVDTITILFLLLAVFFGTQLYSYMQGGELTLSWRWLVGATILFAIAKILEIAHLAGIISEYEWLLRTIYAISALFLTLGFFQQRKVLT
ncbi:hypothetical protein JW877_03125 [bacterium]|nr:hypothetical protein [bacterium]